MYRVIEIVEEKGAKARETLDVVYPQLEVKKLIANRLIVYYNDQKSFFQKKASAVSQELVDLVLENVADKALLTWTLKNKTNEYLQIQSIGCPSSDSVPDQSILMSEVLEKFKDQFI